MSIVGLRLRWWSKHWIICVVAVLVLLTVASCIGGPDATELQQAILGIRAHVDELSATVSTLSTAVNQSAGRDSTYNDDWLVRILGLGIVLLGLSYPTGKIVWMLTGTVYRRVVNGRAQTTFRTPPPWRPPISPPGDL